VARLLMLALLAMLAAAPARAGDCGGGIPCPLGARSYRALPPPGWDGTAALPVLLHFHGWARQGATVLKDGRITGAAAANGMLLLAPDGLGKSWRFWDPSSADIGFAEAVLDDAARRWPVDRSRVVVSGFSYGAAMAWRLACARGRAFAAYLAVAGATSRQEAAGCAPGPVRLVQAHGLGDTVFGLPVAPGEDPASALALWRRIDGAPEAPAREWREAGLDCRDWQGPAPRAEVTLCTHPRGHETPAGWYDVWLPRLLSDER